MSNDTTGPVGPARLVGRGRRVLLSVLAGVLLVVSGGASLATVAARAATSHTAASGGILVAANDSDPASTGVYLTPGQEFSVTATGTGQYGVDQCGSEGIVQVTTD